ncbi:uncharacterized protein [Euwallacea fornicatus]|uniref:uncharacterized protein n=1 Tax=Euwallacea fornicatus TaxID=995702 RepID=UPI00338F8DE9
MRLLLEGPRSAKADVRTSQRLENRRPVSSPIVQLGAVNHRGPEWFSNHEIMIKHESNYSSKTADASYGSADDCRGGEDSVAALSCCKNGYRSVANVTKLCQEGNFHGS